MTSFAPVGLSLGVVFPWAMSAAAVATPPYSGGPSPLVLPVALVGALLVGVVGCREMIRRDVL